MKEVFVQFKSGRSMEIKDVTYYSESADFDILVSSDRKGNELHVTIFRDAVEYMTVKDIPEEDLVLKDPMILEETTRKCNTCAYKDRDYSYCMEIRKCNQYSGYEKEVK